MTTIYTFVPTFRTDIYVHMGTSQWQVNPNYCATDQCAKELAEILVAYAPTIIKASPTGTMYGMFSTDMVPAYEITKDGVTVVILAGILASYFVYLGPQGGLGACIQEIEGTLKTAAGQ